MADMYTTVTVDPEPTEENYPDDCEYSELENYGHAGFENPGWSTIEPGLIAGWSKYEIDGLREFAAAYTEANPGSTVTIFEEWTGRGGPTEEEHVYRNGQRDWGESKRSELVPDSLPDLIKAVREALEMTHPFHPELMQRAAIMNAARALVDALDPTP